MFPRAVSRRCFRWAAALIVAFASLLAVRVAPAVILAGTGDPAANTTAPAGDVAESGWQYEGEFGESLGTVIAPRFFITAKHVAGGSGVFRYRGTDYQVVRRIDDPRSDLTICEVAGTFPAFAPLYPHDDEIGRRFVVVGRGSRRGAEIMVDGRVRGWLWAVDDHVQRWGENSATRLFSGGAGTEYLFAPFDLNDGPNEAHLSRGDSGGAIFLNDGGVWKLAGINYGVDGPFYTAPTSASRVDGALFDANRLYRSNDGVSFSLIEAAAPVPTGFYATRISSKRAWIHSVVDPAGDFDRDGVMNLLEYAFHLDPERRDTSGLPEFRIEAGVPTLTYRTLTYADDIRYSVEKSADLKRWEPVTEEPEYLDWEDYAETYKVAVASAPGQPLYLRLVVTRP